MTIKYSYIAIFAGGLVLGALAQYGVPRLFPSDTEKNGATNTPKTPVTNASWIFKTH